jgi:NTE family protein
VAEQTRKALILPGAGARGAYQVGVLKAIAEFLPVRARNPFAVISGTSAGAINAAVLASRAQNFEHAVKDMVGVWSNFSVDQVFRADSWTMLKSSAHWLMSLVVGGLGDRNPRSLLDNTPLRALLESRVDFSRIQTALERGYLDALVVTASAYTAARSVSFFQTLRDIPQWNRFRRIGRPEVITVDHLLASAAVPFVFPPVRIGGEFYGDGSMRHPAPLSPAIHLGAERLLVIGVRDEHPDPEPRSDAASQAPSLAHLAGYMLDTLFMDGVYTDLERIARINMILEKNQIQHLKTPHGELRAVETLLLLPSQDIRSIAARYFQELPRPMRLLLRGLGAINPNGMQFVSYLLFESGFTSELIELGYRDAKREEEDIRAFMFDQPVGSLDAPGFIKEQIED